MIATGNKRGYTLPLTIAILVVIGFLASTFYTMVKNERIESFKRFSDAQATLELESGVNYAFYRMQSERKPWRTDSLQHVSKDGSIRFSLSQKQDGAFASLNIFNHDSSRHFNAHTGFIPANRPALTLLAAQANASLVGNARIEGGTALRNGTISYSSHYKMRAEKEAFFDTVYVGDSLKYFDTLSFFPELSREQFAKTFNKDRCGFDGTDAVPEALNCRVVTMQGDSRCDHCKIIADKIFIRGRARTLKANIIARTITLKDSILLSGTFFAQDSLEAALKRKQENAINLIVQGRKTGDVDYTGSLAVDKLSADKVLILFMGDNWDETTKGIPVTIGEDVEIRGNIISRGMVDFRGKLTGQMIAYHLGFYEGETLWRGFFQNGKIKSDTTVHTFLPDIIYLGGEASYEN
jgi:cytoskeletal protein CcmA (bactofilin family)